ncbi:hypothetical protein [Corynebacterium phocae]|uniref:hypothetical protein n=1 Tax=Corynebacterium phocae TaxID=161895 RepID=UPI001FEB6F74|nr:hypothetical protein [Corynebacterium phocae]
MWPLVWAVILVALVTWPFAMPGEFLWRDMAVPDHFGFIPENFGAGDLPARNVPQDGALALFSMFAPASWLVRAVVIGAAGCAAAGGWMLAKSAPAPAMALAVVNPFVVERLLQGHWSVAVAAWMLPAIAATALRGHRTWAWLGMFVASLTPTGGLLALVCGTVTARGFRLPTAGVGVALCLPWIIPGVLSPPLSPSPAAVAAFAPRAESSVGTLGSLLTLGGIWNAAALPPSRQVGFALFGLVVALCVALGVRRMDRPLPLVLLAITGWGLSGALWLYPDTLAAAMEHLPGSGLLRDSHKLVALAIPFCVAAVGTMQASWRVVAVAAIFLQMPDFSSALGVLAPRPAETINARLVGQLSGRTAFFPERTGLIDIPGAVAVDPYTKAVSMVHSGQLTVDGEVIDPPSPRFVAAQAAWAAGDMGKLEEMGIGAVVVDGAVVATTAAARPAVPWVLTTAWAFSPVLLVGAAAYRRARQR